MSQRNEDLGNITLQDVQSAIRILNTFMRQEREAKSILRQLGVREGGGSYNGMSMESIMKLAEDEVMKNRANRENKQQEAATLANEEDIKRMREIADKNKRPESQNTP